ncbi:unnamed protein product [Penicillium roqueforti FM164]|uniref:Genomic scaffold, ProqFM164S03 n=1 Tax=Penicillium roqueforti (strain FM164) TaxID=1365484 RepID=W6QCE7_PENRF|nr:unnamed protein product [Penicillium roqueforti FM164]
MPDDFSKISWSTATTFPIQTALIYIFIDPTQTTFLTKSHVTIPTKGVVSPAPSMSVTSNFK